MGSRDAELDLKRLFPLYIGAAIGPMGGIGIVTLIPVLAKLWAIEFGTVSFAITFYMIPFILIQTFSGSIAQIFDVRKTLLFGFVVYSLGGFLCGLSPGLGFLLGSRIVQGIGAAFLTPIIMALIGEIVPEEHVGKAFGILGLAYTAGVTLGPLISGLLEVHYGWSWFFFFLAALSLIAGIFFVVSGEWDKQEGQPRQEDSFFNVFPILRQALTQPGVLYLSFSAFNLFIAYIGIMTFMADYLKSSIHLPSDKIGILLSSTGLSGMIAAPISGFLGDRMGRRTVFLGGTSIFIFCITLMALIPYSYWVFLVLFLFFGAGAAFSWTNLNTMAVQSSSSLRRPVTSIYSAIKFSGYALSPVILSLIYTPFRLKGVQMGCIGAVLISSFLASRVESRSM